MGQWKSSSLLPGVRTTWNLILRELKFIYNEEWHNDKGRGATVKADRKSIWRDRHYVGKWKLVTVTDGTIETETYVWYGAQSGRFISPSARASEMFLLCMPCFTLQFLTDSSRLLLFVQIPSGLFYDFTILSKLPVSVTYAYLIRDKFSIYCWVDWELQWRLKRYADYIRSWWDKWSLGIFWSVNNGLSLVLVGPWCFFWF